MKPLTAALALCVCAFANTEVRIIQAGPAPETAKALGIPVPPGYKQTTFVVANTDDQKAVGFKAVVTFKNTEGVISQVTTYHDFDHVFEGARNGTAWADVDPTTVIDAFVTLVIETGETASAKGMLASSDQKFSAAACTSCTPHPAKPVRSLGWFPVLSKYGTTVKDDPIGGRR